MALHTSRGYMPLLTALAHTLRYDSPADGCVHFPLDEPEPPLVSRVQVLRFGKRPKPQIPYGTACHGRKQPCPRQVHFDPRGAGT